MIYRFISAMMLALICGVTCDVAYGQFSYDEALVTSYDPTGADPTVLRLVDIAQAYTTWSRGANTPSSPTCAPACTYFDLGTIFGIAFGRDDEVYVAAASCYGGTYWPGNGGAGAPPHTVGAGGGSIYRVDDNGQFQMIVRTANDPAYTYPPGSDNVIPNTGVGLGNICLDPDHMVGSSERQLFVTNMEDGMIYRLDTGGTVLSWYNPFGVVDTDPGFPPLGRRAWGIGYFQNRVYYSVWSADCNRPGSRNSIRSVALDATGDFLGYTDRLEYEIPPLANDISNPVSDIEFSYDVETPRMLLAERTMLDDRTPGAYGGRLIELEFDFVSRTWVRTSHDYSIGVTPEYDLPCLGGARGGRSANSSGGCAFGYDTAMSYSCDYTVWTTGDDLLHPIQPVYGLQGLLRASSDDVTNSAITDLSYPTGQPTPGTIGDVDIKVRCATQLGAPDLLQAVIDTSDCCWDMVLSFTHIYKHWNRIRLQLLDPGASFTSVAPPAGLRVRPSSPFNPHIIELEPTGNGGYLDYGDKTLHLCIAPGSDALQRIRVSWLGDTNSWNGPDHREWHDTVTFRRDTTRDGARRSRLDDVTFICREDPGGLTHYDMRFRLYNGSCYTIDSMTIAATAPNGAHIDNGALHAGPVAPNATSGIITVRLDGVTGGNIQCSVMTFSSQSNAFTIFDVTSTLPPCVSCCAGNHITLGATEIEITEDGHVAIRTDVTSTLELRKFRVTSVIAHRTLPCLDDPLTADMLGTIDDGVLGAPPALPAPYAFGAPVAEWGVDPAGVRLQSTPLELLVRFPSPICFEDGSYRIRLTYQDTDCRTCDTVIVIHLPGGERQQRAPGNNGEDQQPPEEMLSARERRQGVR